MTARLVLTSLVVLCLAGLPSAASAQGTGRVIVELRPSVPAAARSAAANAVAARAGARTVRSVPQLGIASLRPAPGRSLAALVRTLRSDPAVRTVRPEFRFAPRYLPDDPALRTAEVNGTPAPGMTVQWAIERENLPAAWDRTRGVGALVAVIDSGIDARHPEFAGKIDRAVDQGGGIPTFDNAGHGTHVASQACAATGNGIGIAGTGFDCRLIVESSDLSESSVAAGVVDAVDHGAGSINMSFGDDGSNPVSQAYVSARNYAYARGVVIVAAAANENTTEQGQPADLLQPTGTAPDLAAGKGLVVTAASYDDRPATFNGGGPGHGTQISLADYGQFRAGVRPAGLIGAFPANQPTEIETGGGDPSHACPLSCRTTFGGDNRYAYLQGTSIATGRVSGIVALVKAFNPDMTAADVIRLMKESARGDAFSDDLGWGIVDAGAAVAAARRIDRTPPVSKLRAPTSATRRIDLTWTGSDPSRPGLVPSGVRRYEVYASRDDGAYRRIQTTTATSTRFTVARGGRYAFFTLAIDRNGNREARPARADASTRVAPR